MSYNNYIYSLIIATIVFIGCRKKDNLFSGSDAIIAAFELKDNETVFPGVIRNDSIIVLVPKNYSLDGAKPFLQVSEQSVITPDPSGVTNWGETIIFSVKSHNGAEKKYTYYVERSELVYEGDLILTTQSAVDSVEALQITQVNGNLVIGLLTAADTIYSLSPLKNITAVAGALKILSTYGGNDLSGLENITKAQSIQIGPERYNAAAADMRLSDVSMPGLEEVFANFDIYLKNVKTLSFAKLHTVGNEFNLNHMDSLQNLHFPLLKEVHNKFSIEGNSAESLLQEISFPALEKIAGGFSIDNWPHLRKILFPKLIETGDFRISNFPHLEEIGFSALQKINGRMDFADLPVLNNANLGKLELVMGILAWSNLPTLTNLDLLKDLKQVHGSISLYNFEEVTNIDGLKKLEFVGNSFTIYGLPKLNDPDLEGLSSLKEVVNSLILEQVPFRKYKPQMNRVRWLSISGQDISTIEEIDVTGISHLEIVNISDVSTPSKIIGKEDGNYQLSVSGSNVVLQGFKKLKSFTFNYYTETDVILSGIEEVTDNVNINLNGPNFVAFSDIKRVGGHLNINVNNPLILEIPQLEEAGRITANVSPVKSFALPLLKKVNGDFSIIYGNQFGMIEEMNFPLLKEVTGTLQLRAIGISYSNTKLTNLNAFAQLEKAGKINISFGGALTDFSAFKKVIEILNNGSWSTINNLYNPTYQDMVEGRYVKQD